MKTVRLKNNVVVEIIPEYALPVEKWYGAVFAAQCMEAPGEVDQNWTYDPETGTWAEPAPYVEPEPAPEPEPTADERISALEAENHLLNQQVASLTDQNDFQEELIVELANIVYA